MGNAYSLLVGVQAGAATMKRVRLFLKKLEIDPPCDPAAPLLGTFPRGLCILQRYLLTHVTAAELSGQSRNSLDVHQMMTGSRIVMEVGSE